MYRRWFAKNKTLTPMMEQYEKCKALYPDYLLLFQVGDFYELFHQDAYRASNLMGITLTKKNNNVPMCGIPVDSLDRYLQRLVKNHGVNVAICNQVESIVEAKKRKSIVDRQVTRLVTPGTLTEDSLLNPGVHNYLASMCMVDSKLAFAWMDVSTGLFQTTRSSVERIESDIARCAPREMIVPELEMDHAFYHSLKEILKMKLPLYCQVTSRPMGNFDTQKLCEIPQELSMEERFAANGLVDYVAYTQKGALSKMKSPMRYEPSEHMVIDASAWKSLEIAKTLGGSSRGSLLDTIDKTQTSIGSRLLSQHLAYPLFSVVKIRERQQCVTHFISNERLRMKVRKLLESCPDIERDAMRVQLGRSSPKDIRSIADGLLLLHELVDILNMHDAQIPPLLHQLVHSVNESTMQLAIYIQTVVTENAPALNGRCDFVKMGYSTELDELRLALSFSGEYDSSQENKSLKDTMLDKYRKETNIPKLRIKEQSKLGFFVEIPIASQQDMPSGFTFSHSTKTHARYKTQELLDIDSRIWKAASKVAKMETAIFDTLVNKVSSMNSEISSAANVLANVDVFSSHGQLAQHCNMCLPLVNDSCSAHIVGGRHLIVQEALAKSNDMERSFVPNDLHLASNSEDDGSTWLITGPNMGGKSTFLRQNAHIMLLAQIGAYVPARYASIGLVDQLFSRVGSSDDLRADRSTFLIEMEETATILNQATSKSFVLMDEVGRGTSIYEGLALSWAVLEELCQRRTRTLYATHFHQMADLAKTTSNLRLRQMRVLKDGENGIIFAHSVDEGASEYSHGIHIAHLAGCPQHVVSRAKEILDTFSGKTPNHVSQEILKCEMSTLTSQQAWNILNDLQKSIK